MKDYIDIMILSIPGKFIFNIYIYGIARFCLSMSICSEVLAIKTVVVRAPTTTALFSIYTITSEESIKSFCGG